MIVINYIKPYIVISANYLMNGVINISIDNQIVKKINVQNESSVNIENIWQANTAVKIELLSQEENTHKIINL